MSGIEFISIGTDDPAVLAVAVKGEIDGASMADFVKRVEELRGAEGKVRLFVDMTGYDGFQWDVVGEKLANFRTLMTSFDSIAYVVDKDWMASWIGLVDVLTPMHIRAFKSPDRDQAISWIVDG